MDDSVRKPRKRVNGFVMDLPTVNNRRQTSEILIEGFIICIHKSQDSRKKLN